MGKNGADSHRLMDTEKLNHNNIHIYFTFTLQVRNEENVRD